MQQESVWKVDVSSLYKLFTLYESIAGGECTYREVCVQSGQQSSSERERERAAATDQLYEYIRVYIYSLYNDGNLRNAIHTHVEEIYTNTQGFLEIQCLNKNPLLVFLTQICFAFLKEENEFLKNWHSWCSSCGTLLRVSNYETQTFL